MHPSYSIDWLLEKQNSEDSLKFLFFWGHTKVHKEEVGKSCFSQWYESPFEVDHFVYQTAEHWMMAQKALLFKDQNIFEKIMAADSPGEAKALGRMVSGFDQNIWEESRYKIVIEGNNHKFTQHPELRGYLINTTSRVLVEASPVDTIWGIGMAQNEETIHNVHVWKGLNLLGFALMEVRDILGSEF